MLSNHHTLKKTSLLLLLTILLLAHLPQAAQAQADPPPAVAVTTSPDGVTLTWSAPAPEVVSAASLRTLLPTARIDGYDLPIQTVTLAVPRGQHPIHCHRGIAGHRVCWRDYARRTAAAAGVGLDTDAKRGAR
jgi:hypothetical protein